MFLDHQSCKANPRQCKPLPTKSTYDSLQTKSWTYGPGPMMAIAFSIDGRRTSFVLSKDKESSF
uniref:Uncharacterized protein n=1 Tax=Megaselia scalaris TaxID=36166 RepID=T1GTH6_MEGSC